MELAFPSSDRPVPDRWLIPLGLVIDEIRDDPTYDFVHAPDFTARALVLRRGKVDVVQYLHAPSGRYLYVDFDGRLFRFVPPRDARRGTGRLIETSLDDALDALRPPTTTTDGRPALRLIHGGRRT